MKIHLVSFPTLLLTGLAAVITLTACGPAAAPDSGGFSFTGMVHPDLPEHRFVLRPAPAADSGDSAAGDAEVSTPSGPITSIAIYDGDRLLQTLADFSAEPIIDGPNLDGFEIEDLNFDGYADLRLIEFLPAGPNIPYLVWLYQPPTDPKSGPGQFQKSDIFASISSPEIDREKQQIVSYWRANAAENGTSYYEFNDAGDQLILVREERRVYESEEQFTETVRELRDGQMVDVP